MTATGFDSTPISSILFVGLELSKSVWKLAFASTDQQNLRIRDVAAGDLGQFQREIREAKRKVDLPEDGQVVTCFEAGRDGFWIHRALDSPCLGNRRGVQPRHRILFLGDRSSRCPAR